MSVINNNLLLTAAAGATGYQVSRSLRFNGSVDNSYLRRTPASAGNRKTWTWAGWIKRSTLGTIQQFFTCSTSGYSSSWSILGFNADKLQLWFQNGSNPGLQTTAVYRDTGAWMHVLMNCDTTQATPGNRGAIYVNGVKVTAFDLETYPSQNFDTDFNSTSAHDLGRQSSGGYYCDFMLADVYWIDGQALTPSSFTETDASTGQLIPKAFVGSYGTNGWHLEFADNSAATAAALGKDSAGSNNWTPNNFSVSGTNYTALLSPSTTDKKLFDGSTSTNFGFLASQTYTITFPAPIAFTSLEAWSNEGASNAIRVTVNGTSVTDIGGSNWDSLSGTSPLSSLSFTGGPGGSGGVSISAIRINGAPLVDASDNDNDSLVDTPTSYGTDTGAGGEVRGNYCTLNPINNTETVTHYFALSNGNLEATFTDGGNTATITGTIFPDSGKWYAEFTPTTFGAYGYNPIGIVKNVRTNTNFGATPYGYTYNPNGQKGTGNVYTNYGASYTTGDVIGIALDLDNGTLAFYKNGVSQGQAFSGVSGNYSFAYGAFGNCTFTANFGQRQWAYAAPAGFKALCDTNLPAPVIAKPSGSFQTLLYTGNGGTQTISGLGFSPDFVWLKARSAAERNVVFDQVRGAGYRLLTDGTFAEALESNTLSAFTSDGFSLGVSNGVNGSGTSMVAWAWDAGTSTVTNNSGSISSQVRANASAGFSIVTYTTPSSGGPWTVGHGLNVAPSLIICKNRSSTGSWVVYHATTGNTGYLLLNATDAFVTQSQTWNSTSPSSTVFTQGTTAWWGSSTNFVSYCFSPVAGYSSMSSYVGNGSSDGPFVYCGFRPRWILVKKTTDSRDWVLYDSARDTYNVSDKVLYPNYSLAEGTTAAVDMLSNGFKIRTTSNNWNDSSGTYIYFAVAENPFQYARAR